MPTVPEVLSESISHKSEFSHLNSLTHQSNTSHVITLLLGVKIRQVSQLDLHSFLSLTTSSLSLQILFPSKLFSTAYLMGFGKHLIAAVTPSHQVFTPLFPINEPIDLFPARHSVFFWNFWSASLSQKREWRDEICVPCLQWYFMCRRLICCDSQQPPQLETQQSPEQKSYLLGFSRRKYFDFSATPVPSQNFS